MDKTIRRNRTVSIQRLAEALAEHAKCDEAKVTAALVEVLLSKSRPSPTPQLYDASGAGLAVAVPRERVAGRIMDLLNSGWWRAEDREQVRRDWDRWRMAEQHGPVVLSFVAEKLGLPLDVRSAGLLSELTEKARRGVSDREDNLLRAIPATTPGYLDPSHPRYSPKLAATVLAWLAVEDPKGRHPKQALSAWLTRNASDFGLTNADGKPNKEGIDDCAKVANWKPSGGAPKTPSR